MRPVYTVESVKGSATRRTTFDVGTYGRDVEARAMAEAADDLRCGASDVRVLRNGEPWAVLTCEGGEDHGWVSAKGGKWHRTANPEPTFMHDETTACGQTFRPLNVHWHGEEPQVMDRWKCKRPGCAS